MSASDLAVILNPTAGGGDRYDERRVKALRALTGSRGVIFSTAQHDLVDAIAEGVHERGVGTVGIIGGDGTVSSTLTALHRVYGEKPLPRIALLRGGTMNTIANALGIPRRQPEELIKRLLESRSSAVIQRATIKVENRLGFLFSAGAMVGFLRVLYATREQKQGSLRALTLLAKGSWQALTGGELITQIETPIAASLSLDGVAEPPRRYTVLAAGTVEQIGLGFRPFPRAAECLDDIQVFAFHASIQALARQLPRIRRGMPIQKGFGFDPLVKRLEIESEDRPLEYALDGDIYSSSGRLLVEVGPRVEVRLP